MNDEKFDMIMKQLIQLKNQADINEEMLRRLNEALSSMSYDYHKISSVVIEKKGEIYPNAFPNLPPRKNESRLSDFKINCKD